MSTLNDKKAKSKELLESYKKEKKYELIKEAIDLDDTNIDIIDPYLSTLEEKNRHIFSEQFSKYKVALPQNILSKYSTNSQLRTQKCLFYSLIFTINKYQSDLKKIITILKANFCDDNYLSLKFNQAITAENMNLFYYNVILQ